MAASIERFEGADIVPSPQDWHERHGIPKRVRCNANIIVDLFKNTNPREKVTLKSGTELTLLAALMDEFVLKDAEAGISYLLRRSVLEELLKSGDLVSLDTEMKTESKGPNDKDESVG